MQYRSFADMNARIVRSRHVLPPQIDLVVGVPRSGLVAGNFLALSLNVPLTDVNGLLENRLFEAGSTKKRPDFERALSDERTVVIIDDTIGSGRAFRKVREKIEAAGLGGNFTYCSVYGELNTHPDADIVLEAIGKPALCEWNVMHDSILADCCMDIDGVICLNPEVGDDDDGPRYQRFLDGVYPLNLPTREVGWLVTGRKEKYRATTEAWLARHGVQYRELLMAPNESDNSGHGNFKAEVYQRLPAVLFIESEIEQADEIASKSGKPVLCVASQQMVMPGFGLKSVTQSLRLMPTYARKNLGGAHNGNLSGIKIRMRQALGDAVYHRLKRIVGR